MNNDQLVINKLKKRFDKLELDARNIKISDKEYTFEDLTKDEEKSINEEKKIINRIHMISKRYDNMTASSSHVSS